MTIGESSGTGEQRSFAAMLGRWASEDEERALNSILADAGSAEVWVWNAVARLRERQVVSVGDARRLVARAFRAGARAQAATQSGQAE